MHNFRFTAETQREMLRARAEALPLYAPSFSETAPLFTDAFASYGIEIVARLPRPMREDDAEAADASSVVLVKWDMPCIYSGVLNATCRLKPQSLHDPTEYERPGEARRYTLAQLLCMICEASSAFSQLGSRFTYDSSIRICSNRACCNPYHRVTANVRDARIEFQARLDLHRHSFAMLTLPRHDVLFAAAPLRKRRAVVRPAFAGNLYLGKCPASGIRVYLSGVTRAPPEADSNTNFEVECVSEEGTHAGWILLSVCICDARYSGEVSLSRSVSASGGTIALLHQRRIDGVAIGGAMAPPHQRQVST